MALKLTSSKGVGYSVLQWSRQISFVPFSLRTLSEDSISYMVHIPVDITTGFFVFAMAIR